MDEIEYRLVSATDAEAVQQLLVDNGWTERATDIQRVRDLISNATRSLGAWHGERLVGFARAITDDVSNGYLSMVVVDPAYRRRGIGSAIVRALMGDDAAITWVLRAGSGHDFWRALGFTDSVIAMERVRRRPV